MNWVNYAEAKWTNQPLSPKRKHVLVQIAAKRDLPPAVAVGYLRFASGEQDSPVFTTPGVGGNVIAWCDCLPADFTAPLWPGTQRT